METLPFFVHLLLFEPMKNLFIFWAILFINSIAAQLITYPTSSPIDFSQGQLLGGQAIISNVTHNGEPFSIGHFNGENTTLNLNEGIILTTGTIFHFNGNGPHGPNNNFAAGFNNGASGCTILSGLIDGNNTFNCSILEFDFVPELDSIQLKYVFGSDEFPEYVGSDFKDIVGIFITGPEYPNPVNIATLPNGNQVSVNGIDTTQLYYINNGNGDQSPYNQSEQYIQYDGYTTPLYAKSAVTIGETYHLIIAIADVSDGILDSGIFIETIDMNVSTEKINHADFEIKLYPNPTIANCTLKLKLSKAQSVHCSITNTLGQVVSTQNLGKINEGVHSLPLNIENLNTGVYFVKVDVGSESIIQRLVIK
jgi:hypothetical protein